MLEVSQLSKRYGRHAVLDAVELSLAPGSLNVLVGPNGAGKSTLLRLLAQLERPTGGRILLDGQRLRAEQVGYLPQDLRFHPLLSVRRVLRFYADVWRQSPEAVQAALVRWGLEAHADKRTRELSGGLRQRLGLAALSLRPVQLLLLDEPGLSLDPHWRIQLRSWLRQMTREGAIALVTTHLLPEWGDSMDRLLNCADGKVGEAETENPFELKEAHDG
ncbi:MAG: ABC transporter-like protein [Puniceicoccaceae bacterium 5H]|nr:MAG: ABC transporter-like protein [Puniceicoccaceae bacterium 5H]